ncbi:DUF1963-domain-containing protein [Neocallimastix californiae]|uniref:DUF1963-domain-containing protein n=1 Tax=Neocallimastix californiae TaxID=1754190 RepID=A0A1Y2CCJ1_9FUNG|nr:DUF1963-domain-containing protein [Neocallimastix californiae]|eukprot:ORY44607.1 DUF1963-domain-containing protein [Neocallimastix californiae]
MDNKAEQFEQLVEVIKRLSKQEDYSIKIEEEKPDIFDSKYGGIPYWTTDKEYPKNSKGEKLALLAQINFDKCDVEEPLPKNGLLQFFIDSNDVLMGVNYNDQISQNNFRVVYHEKIDYNVTKESLEKMDVLNSINKKYHPVYGEFKISLNKNVDYITPYDFRFDKIYAEAYKEVYGKEFDKDRLSYEEANLLCDKLSLKGRHKILGYPYFTQDDPRIDEKYSNYDILLLQIGSSRNILWGDCGVGNFFINKESLINRDFSKVLYNWDCC